MRARAICLAFVLSALALPASAAAAPPVNDNYISSLPINDPGTRLTREQVKDQRDTTEATTQAALFQPCPPMNGAPCTATGGGAENTTCNGLSFGKTIWYDFHPDDYGAVEIQTSAGFSPAIDI